MQSAQVGQITLEEARNTVRAALHRLKPADLPYAPNVTSIDIQFTVVLKRPVTVYGTVPIPTLVTPTRFSELCPPLFVD